ncbi:MAG: hypothetical protein U1F76_22015 [Candidatus Competibacteraceae bacterium]
MLHPVLILLAVIGLMLLGFGVYLFLKTLRTVRRRWQHRRQRRAAVKKQTQVVASLSLPEADPWKGLDVPTYLRQQRQRQPDTGPGGIRF